MLSTIIACALAVAASLAVGTVLLTYVRSELSRLAAMLSASSFALRDTSMTLFEQQRQRLDDFAARITACEAGLKLTSGTHIAGELAALHADVETLARSTRKQLGKVWAELQHDGTIKRNEQHDVEKPEEVRARLRLQHGLPASIVERFADKE